MNQRATSRIVLVEDHSLFAESLALALRAKGFHADRVGLEGVTSGRQLLTNVLRQQPGMVLLDLDLGELGSGIDLVAPLTTANVAVAVVTSSLDRAGWGHCLVLGARAVIPKSASLEEILSAIRRLSEGRAMMSPGERDELIRCWRVRTNEDRELRSRLDLLTRREAEVLAALMLGKQVSDIARERYVSESTVRTQVKAILAKLQVSSQLTAVGLAHKAGWMPPRSG